MVMNSITNIHDLDKNVHLMKEYRKLALGKDMYNYNIVLGKQFGEQMYRASIKKTIHYIHGFIKIGHL